MFFLRKSSLERLPIVMSGVRMGERALQIGVADSSLVGAIATKVGLSGHAAVVVADERHASRVRGAAGRAGALVDVQVSPLDTLPLADGSFDVVVVHAGGVRPDLSGASGVAVLRDALRVLRSGGRVVVIEGSGPGVMARFRASPSADTGAMLTALASAGFKATRLLAEREGYRFFEGLKHDT
ncbi:MAG: class I SAM-dependent methyltransferase [Vicinamibacterales bacterium]